MNKFSNKRITKTVFEQEPKQATEEAGSVVAGKPQLDPKSLGTKPKLSQAQIAQKMADADKSRSTLHLRKLEEEMRQLRQKRLEKIKKAQDEIFEETEEEKEIQEEEKKEKGLLPLSVKRLKGRIEKFRGAKG